VTNGNSAENFSERLKKNWNILSQLGLWIMGIIGTFWLPPPVSPADPTDNDLFFARFVATIIVGLMIVLAWQWGKKRFVWRWWLIALLALILSVVAFLAYKKYRNDWTCLNGSEVVVTGTLTAQAQKNLSDPKCSSTCSDLIKCLGTPDDVWTKESTDSRRLYLTILYVGALPLFIIAFISVVQAIYCNGKT
jgi:hypothetical protein